MNKTFRHPKKELTFPTGYSREDLGMRLYNWLLSTGAKRMMQLTRQGLIVSGPTGVEDGLTIQEHQDWLEDVLTKELSARSMLTDYDELPSKGRYDREWIEERAASAAASNFELNYVRYLESSAKGGRNSKTPVKFKPEMLIGLEHMSKAQQAEHLGCSTATIAVMRRALASKNEKQEPVNDQEWDDLTNFDLDDLMPR